MRQSLSFSPFRDRPSREKEAAVQTYDCEVLFRPESTALRFLPEGPIDLGNGRFSWVAIQHGANALVGSLNVFDLASGKNTTYEMDGRPGFAFPSNVQNTHFVGVERRVATFNLLSHEYSLLHGNVDEDVESTIINDGVLFSDGIVFGTKELKVRTKKAGLYVLRFGAHSLTRLRSDQMCSNGKVILEDATPLRFLDIDSPTKTVVEYTLDGNSLSEPRVVLDLRNGKDVPDGMVATPDGQSVIIAFYNPNDAPHGEARQYSLSTGEVKCVWKTGLAPQVTCPLLIEHNEKIKLVLTTAVEHMPPEKFERHPNSGCLFVGDTPFESVPDQNIVSTFLK